MTKTESGEEKREKKRKYSFNEPSNTKLNAKATEGKDDARFEGDDREGRDLERLNSIRHRRSRFHVRFIFGLERSLK